MLYSVVVWGKHCDANEGSGFVVLVSRLEGYLEIPSFIVTAGTYSPIPITFHSIVTWPPFSVSRGELGLRELLVNSCMHECELFKSQSVSKKISLVVCRLTAQGKFTFSRYRS
jgi:hypothetical protein